MRTIHKRFVTDEANRTIAVQVDYEDWLEIERALRIKNEGAAAVDLSRYAGIISLTEDPLEFQTRIRGEWR